MKYNFAKIILKDIEGNELKNIKAHKILSNLIYNNTTSTDFLEKALIINKGEEVKLQKTEVETIKEIINHPKVGVLAFAKKALIDYIDSVR